MLLPLLLNLQTPASDIQLACVMTGSGALMANLESGPLSPSRFVIDSPLAIDRLETSLMLVQLESQLATLPLMSPLVPELVGEV